MSFYAKRPLVAIADSKMRLAELCQEAREIFCCPVTDRFDVPGGRKSVSCDFRQSFRILATMLLCAKMAEGSSLLREEA